MKQKPTSRKILVIGGGGAIGSAICEKFAHSDFEVLSVDLPGRTSSHARKNFFFDITDDHFIDDSFKLLLGSAADLNSLILVAGGAAREEFDQLTKISDQCITHSLNLNLNSQIKLVKQLSPLIVHGGSIVFISSINAIRAYHAPVYSAAKAGLIGFMRVTAAELGHKNIRANAVLPGTVLTNRTLENPRDLEDLRNKTALKRFASCQEIAEVSFAVSINLTCITGQTLVADCGQTILG